MISIFIEGLPDAIRERIPFVYPTLIDTVVNISLIVGGILLGLNVMHLPAHIAKFVSPAGWAALGVGGVAAFSLFAKVLQKTYGKACE